MLIDTHSHVQFKAFDSDRAEVIQRALDAGVEKIVAVGTDLESSQKAVDVALEFPSVYAAVGIHPHHVFGLSTPELDQQIAGLEVLLQSDKVIAVGEAGLDMYHYPQTKYANYDITSGFLRLQEMFFVEQIKLALKYKKTLIIHNRGATDKLLEILENNWDLFFEKRAVFHCCEADKHLLNFAKKQQIFIGVDGDVTYDKVKQSFIKEVPLELLVLETDSPFFVPEPLRTNGIKRSEPANLAEIAGFIQELSNKDVRKMSRINSEVLIKL